MMGTMHKRTPPIVLEVVHYEDLSKPILHGFPRIHPLFRQKERWAMSSIALIDAFCDVVTRVSIQKPGATSSSRDRSLGTPKI
ncbi:MAG: hypothetical protein EB012_12235 [Gammaproteobacteria bacterium]|nr:hypothetical protein [Gammaproteobacteria bacterium]